MTEEETIVPYAHAWIDTPLGRYALVSGRGALTHFQPRASALLPRRRHAPADARARALLDAARRAFTAYFAGDWAALDALPLAPAGTEFQSRVWRALREIPPGATACYGEIARRLGSPGAARAVGGASRANPIAVAIPCHRAIGRDGGLVGYAGGVDRKRWLLAHEARSGRAQAASSKLPPSRSACALARRRDSAATSI